MAILKAFAGAAGGVMADQWLEMYRCDSIEQGILAVRGQKQISDRSSNTKGDPNVISDGSVIVVNEGQSAIAVTQGEVIGCYTQPGEHIFRGGSASVFSGGGLKGIGRELVSRVGFGGDVAVHQFVLFIDMKEQTGNPFSADFPICVSDSEIGLSITASAHAEGVFSFRITDPAAFYRRIFRGANGTMRVTDILPQLQAEFATALMEASATQLEGSLRLSDIPGRVAGISDAVGRCMTQKWIGPRGFTVVSTAISALTVTDADRRRIAVIERNKIFRDPTMAAATLVGAQAEAVTEAARNTSGGAAGLAARLPDVTAPPSASRLPDVTAAPAAGNLLRSDRTGRVKPWYCVNCRKYVLTNFCPDCGAERD